MEKAKEQQRMPQKPALEEEFCLENQLWYKLLTECLEKKKNASQEDA